MRYLVALIVLCYCLCGGPVGERSPAGKPAPSPADHPTLRPVAPAAPHAVPASVPPAAVPRSLSLSPRSAGYLAPSVVSMPKALHSITAISPRVMRLPGQKRRGLMPQPPATPAA